MTITRNQLLTALAVLGIPAEGVLAIDMTPGEVTVTRLSRTDDGQPIYNHDTKHLRRECEVIPIEAERDTDQATPIFDELDRQSPPTTGETPRRPGLNSVVG